MKLLSPSHGSRQCHQNEPVITVSLEFMCLSVLRASIFGEAMKLLLSLSLNTERAVFNIFCDKREVCTEHSKARPSVMLILRKSTFFFSEPYAELATFLHETLFFLE